MEESAPCSRGHATSSDASTSTSSRATRCAATGSATRTCGRSGSTRRPGAERGAAAVDLPDPGAHRAARHVAQPLRVPAERAGARRRALRRRAAARRRSSSSSTRGRRTAARSSSTRPAVGNYHTYLCDEVVPFVDAHYRDARRRRASRHHRQVERRLRRDGHADAAARPLRRARDARGRRALRALLPAGLPRGGARAARRVRRLVRRASGRTSARGPRSRSARTSRCSTPTRWPPATRRTRTARSTCRSTRRPGSCGDDVWQRWLAWDPVRMVGRHADALRGLRAIYIDAGQERPVLPRPRRRGLPPRTRADRRHRRLLRALRRRRTRASSTATRSRSATSPSASSRRRSRCAGAAGRRLARGCPATCASTCPRYSFVVLHV